MAITNAQQYQQLVNPPMKGKKRPGYRGDAAYGDKNEKGQVKDSFAAGDGFDRDSFKDAVRRGELRNITNRIEQEKIEEKLEPFRRLGSNQRKFQNFVKKFSPVAMFASKFGPLNTRDFFTDNVLGSKNFANITKEQFANLTNEEQEELFDNYMDARMSGKTDAYGNPINRGDGEGSNLLIPQGIMAQAPSIMDQEPEEDEGLRLAFRANGGRIGFRIGSGEGKDVSGREYGGPPGKGSGSNNRDRRRVEQYTKPPTGGGDGGGKGPDTPLRFKKDIPDSFAKKINIGDFINLGLIDDEQENMQLAKVFGQTDLTNIGATEDKFFGSGKKLSDQGEILEDFRKSAVNFKKSEQNTANTPQAALDFMTNRPGTYGDIIENKNFIQNAIDKGFLSDPSDYVNQKPLDQILATGGRVGLMEGGMPYDGGIMDLESARQMYGLGKLVKKVTRTVKKIAKSPIGKAAIIGAVGFGIPGVQSGFFSKGLMGTKFGLAAKNFAANKILGPAMDYGRGTGGILDFLTTGKGITTAIAGASALAGLLTSEQEEEAQELSRGEGIDIEAARRMILQAGTSADQRALAFKADGGRIEYQEGSKEPVAKKTMPLLDMGGKEMDLREDGGFVPIGRMEKADDVPARLSKNEFVFTADAVRNAGDGDVDKGAEVMYNMMKNLEAGGDVSEESQGLEGARKMFQTSQRLGEVI